MSTLLNSAGRRLFARHVAQYAPQDPMYESYTDARGRSKRRRVSLPPPLYLLLSLVLSFLPCVPVLCISRTH